MTDLIADINEALAGVNEAKERHLADLYATAISGVTVVPSPQLRGNQQVLMVSREIYEELMSRYGKPADNGDRND